MQHPARTTPLRRAPLRRLTEGGAPLRTHRHLQLQPWEAATHHKMPAAQLSTAGSSHLADSAKRIHKQTRMEEGWLTRHLCLSSHPQANGDPTCFPRGRREVGQEPKQGRQKKRLPSSVLCENPWACQPCPSPGGRLPPATGAGPCTCPAAPTLTAAEGWAWATGPTFLGALRAQVYPQKCHML